LLTKTSESDVVGLTNRLKNELERYVNLVTDENIEIFLSASFGYGLQDEVVQSLDELMKVADSHLYRRKYYNKHSMRSNMIKSLMSTLFQKSEREEKHSERVSKYCEALSEAMNCNREFINKISVAGSLHDIGKIGISETILNKEGKLDNIEWGIMKLHPVKSAEILETTEEYKDIAEVVAAHHERWDGTGYPNGLRGEGIPKMARIIAVADAYDAMVEIRSYRAPVSKEDAIAELVKCSGTQFDPHIVDVFVNQVLMKNSL
jgi:putative nucleotidyltransferase with HDIG domain